MHNYFDVDSYLSQLNASESILSCDPVPLPQIADNQNYIFISYSHRDYKQVYADLAVMYHAGVRFWYDHGLVAGRDWDKEAKRIIEHPHCVGVIFFLSENLFLSESANKEIDLVRGTEEQSRKNYFCINLTEKLPSRILRDIMRMDDVILDLAGIDMDRISVLANAFSDKTTYLSFSGAYHRKALIDHIISQFSVMDPTKLDHGYLIDQNSNERIPVTEDTFIVGRTKRKCHHCVKGDMNISTVHFSIISNAVGNMIMDLGSTEGTYVNGKRIICMTPVQLCDLDEISFGNQRYVFSIYNF